MEEGVVGILTIPSKTIKLIAENTGLDIYLSSEQLDWQVGTNNLIRWGYTGKSDIETLLNQPEAIKLASDKPRCRQVLRDAEVPTPIPSEEVPCVARRKKHHAGYGFWYCKDQGQLAKAKNKGAVYFSKYFPKTEEYRVHIGSNKVLLYSVKVGDKTQMTWNKKSGFLFRHLGRSLWDIDIIRLAKKAIKQVGLDFGAVDILAFPSDTSLPKAVVCEINTSPALSPYGVRKYSEYFEREISESSSEVE